jgi:hypothetical protein
MTRPKNDPAMPELPAPISLQPEQLAQVAADTGAMLGAGGGVSSTIIYIGGYLLGKLANAAN